VESNNPVLGQLKVDEKLLRVFEFAGCIVTIDAMGCQKKIARELIKPRRITYWRSEKISRMRSETTMSIR
jgi:predicted transposase YbfD/YdcC